MSKQSVLGLLDEYDHSNIWDLSCELCGYDLRLHKAFGQNCPVNGFRENWLDTTFYHYRLILLLTLNPELIQDQEKLLELIDE